MQLMNCRFRDIYRQKPKLQTPGPIVVDFTSTITKEAIIKSVRSYNKNNQERLSTAHLQIEGSPGPVYVAEYLTAKSKRLFYLAREHKKKNNLMSTWTNFGKIFIIKDINSIPIRIDEESDFKNLNNNCF